VAPEPPPAQPPAGPADVIGQARELEERRAQEQREERAAPSDAVHRVLQGEAPELATAEPDANVPAGTIRVQVVEASGEPAAGADVLIGIMRQGNDRGQRAGQADAAGLVEFSGLPTGSAQAYRVNVPHEGAKYSSTPFRLPADRGYAVQIKRLPVTRDVAKVFQVMLRTIIEIRETRLHVTQQSQLVNFSEETVVFPADGVRVGLPEDYIAFQTQAVMTDQRLEEAEGEGFRIRGSFPPGRVTLVWGYDLPMGGSSMDITIPIAFRTFQLRVEAEAPQGLDLDVDRMPRPEPFTSEGHRFLITELQQRPEDTPVDSLRIHLTNIPGPSPIRWVAMGAGLVFFLAALLFLVRGRSALPQATAWRKKRQQELLDEALELEQMLEREEIGPKYKARKMEGIVDELAMLLKRNAVKKPKSPGKAKD